MRRGGLAMLAAGLALSPAGALAQQARFVACEVTDFSIALRLQLPLAFDGTGAPGPKGMEGSLEIFHQKVPKDRRLWSLDGMRPVQFWNVEPELKMMIALATGEEPIRLLIEAKRLGSNSDYTGTFTLLAGGMKLSGRLACVAD